MHSEETYYYELICSFSNVNNRAIICIPAFVVRNRLHNFNMNTTLLFSTGGLCQRPIIPLVAIRNRSLHITLCK